MVKFVLFLALVAIASADYTTYQEAKVEKAKDTYISPGHGSYRQQYAPRYDYPRYSGRYSPYEYLSGGVYSRPQSSYDYGSYSQSYNPYHYGAADRTYGVYDSASQYAHEPYKNYGYNY